MRDILNELNYCYILYHDDEFKYIEYVADTQREIADYLNINDSVISRHLIGKFSHRKGFYICERIQIHDYCFVVYEKYTDNIIFASKKLEDISKKFKVSLATLKVFLRRFFHPNSFKIRSDGRFPNRFINGKYSLEAVDLLDLDSYSLQNLTNLIESGKSEDLDF